MLVLGFDTATPAVSVAVHDGVRVAGEALAVDARRHGELLMPMIAEVMAAAGAARTDLTAVAVGVGPGPYTGLRVGVVTARVLASVLGIPLYGVCTLDVIAAEVPATGGDEFLVATDARRKEVYWARYAGGGRRLEGPLVGAAAAIPGAFELDVAGTGGQLYPESFGQIIGPAYPQARTLAQIVAVQLSGPDGLGPGVMRPGVVGPGVVGAGVVGPGVVGAGVVEAGTRLLAAEPLYLRRPDAREPGPPKRVTPS